MATEMLAKFPLLPDTRRSLGMSNRLKGGQQWSAGLGQRELLQVKLCGLFEVGYRLLNGVPLADCPYFGAFGYI